MNFLETDEDCLENADIPNCFHFASSQIIVKSPKIPVVVEGIRVPMILDTGAEVSTLPVSFFEQLFPGQTSPELTTDVRSLGGSLIRIRGPVRLRIEVCDVAVSHPFYFHDENPTFLMGYDLISAAALVIDPLNRCVWSRFSPSVDSQQNRQSEFGQNTHSVVQSKGVDVSTSTSIFPVTLDSDDTYLKRPTTDMSCSTSCTFGPRATSYSGPRADDLFSDPRVDDLLTLQHDRSRFCSPSVLADVGPFSSDVLSVSEHPFSTPSTDSVDRPVAYGNGETDEPDSLDGLPILSETVVKNTWDRVPPDKSVVDLAKYGIGEPGTYDLSKCMSNLFNTEVTEAFDREPPDKYELPEHVNLLFLQTVEENNLTSDVVQGLKELLHDHEGTFAASSTDLGFCSIIEHDIDTGDSRPLKQSPRKPPFAARDAEDEILNEMLEAGVIEPSMSPWASPVCLVKKKDGTYRFCVDYRRVNAVSKKDAYPLPDIQDALDNLRGSKYFATIDLLSGYWQLGMTDRAKECSAFCTRRGLFQFTRMPFGLSGAPSSFCRLMGIVLRDLLWDICLCYCLLYTSDAADE